MPLGPNGDQEGSSCVKTHGSRTIAFVVIPGLEVGGRTRRAEVLNHDGISIGRLRSVEAVEPEGL